MSILTWIVLGALAGWVASIIMGRNSTMGLIANIGVGIVGAFVGGYVMNQMGRPGVTGFNIPSFLIALLGAVILLAIVNLFSRRR